MVAILKGVLLGILVYVAIIPILEELATVIIQGLEVVKGKLVLHLAKLQDKADKLKESKSQIHAIGFSLPNEEEDEEEYEDDDDQS